MPIIITMLCVWVDAHCTTSLLHMVVSENSKQTPQVIFEQKSDGGEKY